MFRKIFISAAVLLGINANAQKSQIDWLKIRKYKVAELDHKVMETSALSLFSGRLFTINDSGNPAEIYEISPKNGALLNTFFVENISNFDWEALTNDGEFFYIGDIGNNWGTRSDLAIYKIPISEVLDNQRIKVEKIKYNYPEQKQLIKSPNNNDFDAESLVYMDNALHLFTKEWVSYKTTHYKIPINAEKETIPAEKLEDYNLGYLATEAAYFDNLLYIIGYTKKMEIYLSVFNKNEKGLFFSQKPEKYFLGMATALGQVEGISVDETGIYISAERFKKRPFNVPQTLYFIPKNKLKIGK
ncbi:MAG: hypothetical protein Q4C75_06990 [Bergeyella zoohelcum]|nr:hypothetical protein [Bergeyella zoohelcum]